MTKSPHTDLVERFGNPLERVFDEWPGVYISYKNDETHLYLGEEKLCDRPVSGFYIASGEEVPEARPSDCDFNTFKEKYVVYVQYGNRKVEVPEKKNANV